MNYFLSCKTKEGYIYSCDKICIVGKIAYEFSFDFGLDLDKFLWLRYLRGQEESTKRPWDYIEFGDYVQYLKFGYSEFRNNYTLKLSNGSTFWFGCYHNSDKGQKVSWKLELNPNKCLPCDFVFEFLRFLHSHSSLSSFIMTQFDLAIDFPFTRSSSYLDKDMRTHSIINSGDDNITEYLSKHNQHGFVKLYNKTKESNLKYELTRLEITLKEFYINDVLKVFPKIHIADNSQISFDDKLSDLSDNDKVFVELLRLHPHYFDKLTYRKRQKFAPYVSFGSPLYELDVITYEALLKQIKKVFVECPMIE